MAGFVAVLAALAAAILLFRPAVFRSREWHALATPLASIIGSGFLVSVPVLDELVGSWAVAAIFLLLALSYAIGAAVRENIAHVEPLLENGEASGSIASLERLSHVVLAFAYFVSVAYYLVLFANFALRPAGLDEPFLVKLLVSALLAVIGIVGLTRGFAAVERLEIHAVSVKLAVIAGLLAALAFFDGGEIFAGRAALAPGHFRPAELPVLVGLLILVQGFETSRFLGSTYSAELRIRTMRLAQLLAAAIYLAFFVLMMPLMGGDATGEGVAAIIDMLAPVSFVLPLLVVLGALASQSSAAIADALGAGGLLHTLGGRRIRLNHTYPLIALVAGLITWDTDVYGLIAFASRCFALYYALQCLLAALSAARRGRLPHAVFFFVLALAATGIVLFGTPAEGG